MCFTQILKNTQGIKWNVNTVWRSESSDLYRLIIMAYFPALVLLKNCCICTSESAKKLCICALSSAGCC